MKKIKLKGKHGKGKFALVDDEDYELVSLFKWFPTKLGYVRSTSIINNKKINISLHILIMKHDNKKHIDHKNGNPLDNRKNNLRFCTRSQNYMNKKGAYKNSTSKYKGVHWRKGRNTWRAGIGIDGKAIHLGTFKLEIEAAKAYNEKALELFGEFANINAL